MAKILIVDDEQAILEMYAGVLSEKHEVLTAKNGEEALKLAGEQIPALIFLDIIMPQENGLDVLAKLKQDKKTAGIPVVVLTNLPKEASSDKAQNLGAVDYLVKAEIDPSSILIEAEKYVG